MDPIPHAPGMKERERKDPQRGPERPVVGDIGQREPQRPLGTNFVGNDSLPRNSEIGRLAEKIFHLPLRVAHRPHREITCAVIA